MPWAVGSSPRPWQEPLVPHPLSQVRCLWPPVGGRRGQFPEELLWSVSGHLQLPAWLPGSCFRQSRVSPEVTFIRENIHLAVFRTGCDCGCRPAS